ncbi:tetratricopeptide repeat protein [Amycolatopsis sp. NPDC026612]|uniref:tetratricopeptide repeat protein n=1 Tax=Amycolatopsis sp. NPDC026612 TaxID=3155466 RepID=UPI0033DC1F88
MGTVVQAGSITQSMLPAFSVPIPRQLPPGVRDFTGRAKALADLDVALSASETGSAVAVVEGMGGVGKTSLVTHWAHRAADRFPDGTLFANLRGYGPSAPLEPAVVLSGFVQALGVSPGQVPADKDALVGLYRSLLADRRVLVVLDNAASAEQVRPLLPGTTGCAVAVTSRTTLTGLRVTDGAIGVAVAPMPAREATVLVRGVVGGRRADTEVAMVAELVALCGGLPLAVRVAACRAASERHGGVAGVVAGLRNQRDRVMGLSVSGDERSAVQTVFDLSYHRLTVEQARVFRLLGLHPGPEFGVPAIAALTDLGERVAYRMLEDLADLHLVEPVGTRRYRLHDLLHAYAVTRAEADEPGKSRKRATWAVVTWYAQAADVADRVAFPALPRAQVELPRVAPVPVFDREEALAWFDTELPTLSVAVRIAHREQVWAAAVVLAGVHRVVVSQPRAWWPSRLAAETAGVAAARAGGFRQAEALLLLRLADSHRLVQSWDEAYEHCEQALRLGRELEDVMTICNATSGLGLVRLSQQRYTEALQHYLDALPISQATGQPRLEAVVECNLSEIRVALGQYGQALEHAERELVLRCQAGDELGEAYALYGIALARWKLGDHQVAIDTGERAVEKFSASGATSRFAVGALELLASVHTELGLHDRAIHTLRAMHALMVEFGDPRADEVVLRLRDLEAAAPPESAAGGTGGEG